MAAATAAAVRQAVASRISKVRSPRQTRNAAWASRQPPKVMTRRCTCSCSSTSSVVTAPATTSEWPARNLVADSTTTSAPSPRGRTHQGEAKVLSTTIRAPAWWAASATAGTGSSRSCRLDRVSP